MRISRGISVKALVLSLDEVGAGDAGRVGGKGANLGELLRNDFPVPPGFVVCAGAYARFLETLDLGAALRELISAPPDEIVQRCTLIRDRLENEEFSKELSGYDTRFSESVREDCGHRF